MDGRLRRRTTLLVASLVALGTATAGCGATGGAAADAEAVVHAFAGAVAARDGAQACDLLAPAARQSVEASAQQPCPVGLVETDLPPVGAVRDVQQWGERALITGAGDSVFVARVRAGWRVVAAGCTPPRGERDRPYDCVLSGG